MNHLFKSTHQFDKFRLRNGYTVPFGATKIDQGINFSIFSSVANSCILLLYRQGEELPFVEIPFLPEYKIGHVFAMIVYDIDYRNIEYGFRLFCEDYRKKKNYIDPSNILLDPFARDIHIHTYSPNKYFLGAEQKESFYPYRARIPNNIFDWGYSNSLNIKSADLTIYEMHVRGFTQHTSSSVTSPGTYSAIIEKIPYLKSIGINCIELMPIFTFDYQDNIHINPETQEQLVNYWGYNTIGFHALEHRYAKSSKDSVHITEFKNMVAQLHTAGIAVILDVVFNHTAEGTTKDGFTFSFRGIDNNTYYIMNENSEYADFTGCGNTLNCNHPVVRYFILDNLRYWVSEFHIDGFRFDLASVLGRDQAGTPLSNPPLLELIAYDPILANCILIAEAWDAAGLYQVGTFPSYQRWLEWNGFYRDTVRQFLNGTNGCIKQFAQALLGSPQLYASSGRKPTASVNFITCHDGFTLRDLYSYNFKNNLSNGENNRDGSDNNYSWNCGCEGETDDISIKKLRCRMQKNALSILYLSQGIPMLLMGDECNRTQLGNNNAYCHDKPWNWLNWDLNDEFSLQLKNFVSFLTSIRHYYPQLRREEFFTEEDIHHSGYPDISWHGTIAWKPDWNDNSHSLAFMISGEEQSNHIPSSHFIYVAINMWIEKLIFNLPLLPTELTWHVLFDTSIESLYPLSYIYNPEQLNNQLSYYLMQHSIVVLIGKK